jgi:hypothetical protein
MTIRKPLVIASGQIQQLQSGDTLQEVEQLQSITDAIFIAGQVVYSSAAGHVDKAKADSATTAKVIGLAVAAASSGATVGVQCSGVVTLTTGEWDACIGTTGGLTYNTVYYLSGATAGLGTSTAPSTVGHRVVQLGTAISTTELLINIKQSVLL